MLCTKTAAVCQLSRVSLLSQKYTKIENTSAKIYRKHVRTGSLSWS